MFIRDCNNTGSCLSDDLQAFGAVTAESAENPPLVFGVETVLWTRAVVEWGMWYRGVMEGAEQFMEKWHREEAARSSARHVRRVEKARSNRTGNGEGGCNNSSSNIIITAADESRTEMADRVARFQFD